MQLQLVHLDKVILIYATEEEMVAEKNSEGIRQAEWHSFP